MICLSASTSAASALPAHEKRKRKSRACSDVVNKLAHKISSHPSRRPNRALHKLQTVLLELPWALFLTLCGTGRAIPHWRWTRTRPAAAAANKTLYTHRRTVSKETKARGDKATTTAWQPAQRSGASMETCSALFREAFRAAIWRSWLAIRDLKLFASALISVVANANRVADKSCSFCICLARAVSPGPNAASAAYQVKPSVEKCAH